MFLSLKTLYRKRTVIWPFYFYTIIRTLSAAAPREGRPSRRSNRHPARPRSSGRNPAACGHRYASPASFACRSSSPRRRKRPPSSSPSAPVRAPCLEQDTTGRRPRAEREAWAPARSPPPRRRARNPMIARPFADPARSPCRAGAPARLKAGSGASPFVWRYRNPARGARRAVIHFPEKPPLGRPAPPKGATAPERTTP